VAVRRRSGPIPQALCECKKSSAAATAKNEVRERMTMLERQDELYGEASSAYAAALERLARSYEADPDKRRDLLQEIHLALWRSFAGFEEQCSLRTWIYRVAHNVAASHVIRHRRQRPGAFVTIDEAAEEIPVLDADHGAAIDRQRVLDQLYALIHRLEPIERQVILLYLEGFDGASIGEVTGISAVNAATRVHRIKKVLAAHFRKGETDVR
jgi:RNA polymerase sigma-70 factor, ECF subfamily